MKWIKKKKNSFLTAHALILAKIKSVISFFMKMIVEVHIFVTGTYEGGIWGTVSEIENLKPKYL